MSNLFFVRCNISFTKKISWADHNGLTKGGPALILVMASVYIFYP